MNKTAGKTLSESAYLALRADIIAGRLAPDAKLRIEDLRQEYDTGASPLREALNRLAGEGFVTAAGQRGFNVAPISLKDLDDITRLRILLECEAMRDAIRQGDDHWEAGIVAAFHQWSKIHDEGARDVTDFETRNQALHEALIAACDSPLLLRLRQTLFEQHKRYRLISLLDHNDTRDIHAEHQAIVDAALARDADAACSATEIHIRRTADTTREAFAKYAATAGQA